MVPPLGRSQKNNNNNKFLCTKLQNLYPVKIISLLYFILAIATHKSYQVDLN